MSSILEPPPDDKTDAQRLARVREITAHIATLTDVGHHRVRGFQTPAMRMVLRDLRKALGDEGRDGVR